MKKMIAAACLALLTAGCATSFSGSAKVDGPVECRKICRGWGMDLAGMVAMGGYTNGCICRAKGEQLSLDETGRSVLLSSAGAAGGSVGVLLQMQDD